VITIYNPTHDHNHQRRQSGPSGIILGQETSRGSDIISGVKWPLMGFLELYEKGRRGKEGRRRCRVEVKKVLKG
jgi:hypothetical protein